MGEQTKLNKSFCTGFEKEEGAVVSARPFRKETYFTNSLSTHCMEILQRYVNFLSLISCKKAAIVVKISIFMCNTVLVIASFTQYCK